MELREGTWLMDVLRAYPAVPPEAAPLVLDADGHYLHAGDPVRIKSLPLSPASRGIALAASTKNAPGKPVFVTIEFLDGDTLDWPASGVVREHLPGYPRTRHAPCIN